MDVNIVNCTFTANTATTNGGGAFLSSGANATLNYSVVNCNFLNNAATYTGGGLGISTQPNSTMDLDIANCNFANNVAELTGGGLHLVNGNISLTNAIISNSSFTNNTAGTNGGGLMVTGHEGTDFTHVGVVNSTFTNNRADVGGGIYNNDNTTVSGNVMKGNTANTIGNVIYNNGTMGILNLTYINNVTKKVKDGQTVVLFADLTDDCGNPVTGQNISFYANGTFIGSIESIEGIANLTYKANGPDGTIIPITRDYDGHPNYSITILPCALKISKTPTNTTINVPKDAKINKTYTIDGVLSDEFGNTIPNVDLVITINGKDYNLKTDANGRWSLKYKPTHVGAITVVAKYDGNEDYYSCINNTSFNVKDDPIEPPIDPNDPNNTNNEATNKTTKNPVANATMKKTGIPIIAIILALFALFGVITYRKKE
jgi:hypothetical protein